MRIERIPVDGELPIIVAITQDSGDYWLSQGDDHIAMTREQAVQVRDALNRLLEPVF